MNRELDWTANNHPALFTKDMNKKVISAMLMPNNRRSIKMTYYKY